MDADKLEMLVQSYGLDFILEHCDIEPVYVLELLIDQREIELDDIQELFE